jgi:hypothetical protein
MSSALLTESGGRYAAEAAPDAEVSGLPLLQLLSQILIEFGRTGVLGHLLGCDRARYGDEPPQPVLNHRGLRRTLQNVGDRGRGPPHHNGPGDQFVVVLERAPQHLQQILARGRSQARNVADIQLRNRQHGDRALGKHRIRVIQLDVEDLGVWAESPYQMDLSVAPGWKIGGWIGWARGGPWVEPCPACGTPTEPLLTIASWEWDGGQRRRARRRRPRCRSPA